MLSLFKWILGMSPETKQKSYSYWVQLRNGSTVQGIVKALDVAEAIDIAQARTNLIFDEQDAWRIKIGVKQVASFMNPGTKVSNSNDTKPVEKDITPTNKSLLPSSSVKSEAPVSSIPETKEVVLPGKLFKVHHKLKKLGD